MTVNRQAAAYPAWFFLAASEEERLMALTFDDGPVGDHTAQLLDILGAEQVRATFFVLGNQVQDYPELVQRIVDEDHELGNHSWSHADLRSLSNEEILKEELIPTNERIWEAVGLTPPIMRPPYGALRDDSIEFLGEAGWLMINWAIDSFDWDSSQNSAEEIAGKVLTCSHPGVIVLMHSGEHLNGTVSALPQIIRALRAGRYEFVTISELLSLD